MSNVLPDGLLVLDKPAGITSRAAVDRALRWFPAGTRMGHTGTLDPLATGVLVLCVGTATRLTEQVQALGKVYRSTFRLGVTSDTDDADGTLQEHDECPIPSREQVESELAGFRGVISQLPPAYSAIRIGGRRSHDLARKGKPVELEPRPVRIDAIDVLRYEFPWLEVEVRCGKGTYIRSLARDLGQRLGTGGMVQSLRRTAIGPFRVEEALSLEATAKEARERLRPILEALVEVPRLRLSDEQTRRFADGQRLAVPGQVDGLVAVLRGDDMLIGLGELTNGWLRATRVWARQVDGTLPD